jgi:pimeloyl-ACP methyl ester carboxylesterase
VALSYYHRNAGPVSSMVFLNGAFKHTGGRRDLDTPYERNLEAICRAVDRQPAAAARLRRLFDSGGFGEVPAGAAGANGAVAGVPPASLAAAVRRPFLSDSSLIAYARQHLDFWEHDPTGNAANVTVPALFIAAEHDEIVSPAAIRDAAQRFPAACYQEIAGASHYALFEQADLVAMLIGDFVCHAGA